MSKIFDAYKKKVGQSPDFSLEIGKAGAVSLYPSPDGAQREDFNRLANLMLNLRRDDRGTVLSFASSAAGEGSSFVSYNAAIFLASVYNQKVAWLDANFLSPQKKLLGQERNVLSDLIRDPSLVGDLLVADNPLLIAGGNDLSNVRGMFADQNFQDLAAQLAERFDFVILDLPPVLNSTDTALMARGTDGFLLVIEQKYLKREVIEHGLKALREKGVQLLGSVINRRVFELPKIIYDRL